MCLKKVYQADIALSTMAWYGFKMAHLIIMCGLQGTGKTTVGKKIAKELGAVMLRTDLIRREITNMPLYTEESRRAAYTIMFARAQKKLAQGKDVLLDATFSKKEHRVHARKIAYAAKAKFTLVWVICSEEIVRERLEARVGDASDAGFAQYLEAKSYFESPEEENPVLLDTTKNWSHVLGQFISAIREK